MNVLLYAPSLVGHPQVYCRVIADILLRRGASVSIASGTDNETWTRDWPDLKVYHGVPGTRLLDTRRWSAEGAGQLTAEELRDLQRDSRTDSTLFIEGDQFEDQFRRIAQGDAPSLLGRTSAIFARTCCWHPQEDPYTGERPPLLGPGLRGTLGKVRRTLFNRESSPRFFYENTLIRKGTVDAVIVKDERITRKHGPPVHWMPEIYRVFDPRPEERRRGDWERFAEPVMRCVQEAGSGRVLLYFGTGTWYKGYDYFLNLAATDPDTIALHAGAPERHEPAKPYTFNTEALRRKLRAEGRLFETGAFVESADLMQLLF